MHSENLKHINIPSWRSGPLIHKTCRGSEDYFTACMYSICTQITHCTVMYCENLFSYIFLMLELNKILLFIKTYLPGTLLKSHCQGTSSAGKAEHLSPRSVPSLRNTKKMCKMCTNFFHLLLPSRAEVGRCGAHSVTLDHIFWTCPTLVLLWRLKNSFPSSILDEDVILGLITHLLGLPIKGIGKIAFHLISHVLTASRCLSSSFWKYTSCPSSAYCMC